LIVVAGEALVDILVRPDGSIAAVPGGGPYNVARAIGRLGPAVAWLGALSTDRFGQLLETGLAADGVSLQLVHRTELPTTLALAEVGADGSGTYRFYTDGTAAPQVRASGPLPAGTRALHVGTLGLVLDPIATTLERLVASLPADVLVMVDPNCRPSIISDVPAYQARIERVLRRAHVVKVSTEDLAFLRPGEDLEAAIAWLVGLGPRAVFVTDGDAPVRVVAEGQASEIEVPRVDVVDTVGAGDAFGGAALACLVQDAVTPDRLDAGRATRAARFGIRAAAISCMRAGADPPTLAEVGGWPT